MNRMQQRRRLAARNFILRILLLMAVIGGLLWGGWLAPWARHPRTATIEVR